MLHARVFVSTPTVCRAQILPALFLARRGVSITVLPGGVSSEADSSNSRRRNNKKDTRGRPSYRFVDRTRVRVQGGAGGKGCLSMNHLPGRGYKRRPDGGHGGRGGNVIIVADPNEQSLRWSHPHVRAESGGNGGSQEMNGKHGDNLVMRVPCGVVVRRILDYGEVWDPKNQVVSNIELDDENDMDTEDDQGMEYVFVTDGQDDDSNQVPLNLAVEHDYGESITTEGAVATEADWMVSDFNEAAYSERESIVLADLDKPGSHVVVARGGAGGYGSGTLATRGGPLPDQHYLNRRARAVEGEAAFLELELKMIADVALVGFPNAGKSSLLAAMSRATPAIAPYPFTTLHPLIGCIEYRDGFQVRVADIPGLIGGASKGRGRGHDFLRHVERTKALIYIVDSAGVDGRDPIQDLVTLTSELSAYGEGDLMSRPALVLANKTDLLDNAERDDILFGVGEMAREAGIRFDDRVIGISAGVTGDGLSSLSRAIRRVVNQSDDERAKREEEVFVDEYNSV